MRGEDNGGEKMDHHRCCFDGSIIRTFADSGYRYTPLGDHCGGMVDEVYPALDYSVLADPVGEKRGKIEYVSSQLSGSGRI